MDTSETKVKTVSGPKAAIATFIRPDGKRIYVFKRPRESDEHAITRVKKRNQSSNVEHQLIK